VERCLPPPLEEEGSEATKDADADEEGLGIKVTPIGRK
jgi:hypothetical protein